MMIDQFYTVYRPGEEQFHQFSGNLLHSLISRFLADVFIVSLYLQTEIEGSFCHLLPNRVDNYIFLPEGAVALHNSFKFIRYIMVESSCQA